MTRREAEAAIWCAAYGAAYAGLVAERKREGRDPLPEQYDTEEAIAIADEAVEDFRESGCVAPL